MNKIIYLSILSLVIIFLNYCTYGEKDGKIKPDTSGAGKNQKDTISNLAEPYEYDTILKGNYSILFKVDDSTEYLFLKKGLSIKQISSCSRGLPYKNLGYKAADFTNYFILAHSFGSGNDTYIELIDKSTGGNILDEGAVWIGADELKEILVYYLENDTTMKNKFILYDIKRKQKNYYRIPTDILNQSTSSSYIRIDTITNDKLIISYSLKGAEKMKSYFR